MPLAKEVAAELRKVAHVLDRNPEVEVTKPSLNFFYSFGDDKDMFLANARILPRPVNKKYPTDNDRYPRVWVENSTPALSTTVSIYRESLCRLIKPAQPAEYDCELTLLDHEDAALTEA